MGGVRGLGHFISCQRCIETWPPGVRLKFRIGAEELIAAGAAEIDSLLVIVPIQILVWRLCFRFAQNFKLAWGKDLSPLVITQCHLLRHRSGLDLPPDSSDLRIFRQTQVDGQNKEQKQEKRFHSWQRFASRIGLRFLQTEFLELRLYDLLDVRIVRVSPAKVLMVFRRCPKRSCLSDFRCDRFRVKLLHLRL